MSDNISFETQITLTNASLNVRANDLSSFPESNYSESQQEVEQERNKSNESSSVVTSKLRKISTTTQKMSVDSISPEAKQVLLILKQAKKLVKYVKLVSIFE